MLARPNKQLRPSRRKQAYRRRRGIERLESRHLLVTLAGDSITVNEVFDNRSLAGELTAAIDWGDGMTTSADVSGGTSSGSSLVGRVDYSLDTQNFFDTQLKRDLFQSAVDAVLTRLGDDLAAIAPQGADTWTANFLHPGTGAPASLENLQVAANEIVIYAGARELGGTLGVGGPGGFHVTCVDASFCDTVATRGEAGAAGQSPTDFGPWGGSISLDITTDFFISPTIDGIQSGQSDLLSVVTHELLHLLGFGTARSWNTYRDGSFFVGPAAQTLYGGAAVPLASDGGHWLEGTLVDGQETAMDESLTTATRKLPTELDFAGLADVGWELLAADTAVTGSHTYAEPGSYDVVVTLSGSVAGSTSKSLRLEVLPFAWHNSTLRWDVDGDGQVAPIDVLRIINELNRRGARELLELTRGQVPPFLDVNDDGYISPLDALQVINHLNGGGAQMQSEASGRERLGGIRPGGRTESEREIVLLADQIGDTFTDDLVADLGAAFDRSTELFQLFGQPFQM